MSVRVRPGAPESFLIEGTRNATVTAETSIDWLVLDQMSLRDAIDRVPGLGWKILLSVAACLSVAARLSDANTELT